jgi:hypothetical protein
MKSDQKITVPYHLVIKIELKGHANKHKNEDIPYLPVSFYEYIQVLANRYTEKFKDDGYFNVLSMSIASKNI